MWPTSCNLVMKGLMAWQSQNKCRYVSSLVEHKEQFGEIFLNLAVTTFVWYPLFKNVKWNDHNRISFTWVAPLQARNQLSILNVGKSFPHQAMALGVCFACPGDVRGSL